MSSLRRPTAERYGTIDIPSHHHASQYRHVSIDKVQDPPRKPTDAQHSPFISQPPPHGSSSYAPTPHRHNFEVTSQVDYYTPKVNLVPPHEEKRNQAIHLEEKRSPSHHAENRPKANHEEKRTPASHKSHHSVHYADSGVHVQFEMENALAKIDEDEHGEREEREDKENINEIEDILTTSYVQVEENPRYVLKITVITEIVVVVLALVTAILYTMVSFDTHLWYIILWCAFSWIAAISSLPMCYTMIKVSRNFRKRGQRPKAYDSFLSLAGHIDYGVFAAMTIIASLLFVEYVYQVDLRGEVFLYLAALINIPVLPLKYISTKTVWEVAKKHREIMKNYGYLANIFFASCAWVSLLLCKFDVVADAKLLDGVVSDWLTYGNCLLIVASINLSVIYLIFHTFNVRALQVLVAIVALAICLMTMAVSGLQARQIYDLRSEDQLEGELPFRLTIVFVLSLALYGFVLASLAIMKASHGHMRKMKVRFHMDDVYYWIVYLIVSLVGLDLCILIQPYGETNTEVLSDV